jgi:FkbM family methyltransferase
MIGLLRRGARHALRRLGYVLARPDEYQEKLEPVRYDWLKGLDIKTVIDVGASDGGFARRARKIFPHSRLYCFEPLDGPFQQLARFFEKDPLVTAVNCALTNQAGGAKFHANEYSGSSSLLEMAELHKKAYPFSSRTTTVRIECDTLDRFFSERPTEPQLLLKLDVQGGERLVLEGAKELLRRVLILYAEITFWELYAGQSLADEFVHFLGTHGFALVGIENVSQSLVDGRFLQADAYFLNRSLMDSVPIALRAALLGEPGS